MKFLLTKTKFIILRAFLMQIDINNVEFKKKKKLKLNKNKEKNKKIIKV